MFDQCVMSSVQVPLPCEWPALAGRVSMLNTTIASNGPIILIRVFSGGRVCEAFWTLCIFFNMGVFYRPPGDFSTIALTKKLFCHFVH